MKNLSEMFVGQVSEFNQGNSDKNGLMPVIITNVAGKCPNRNVLSGTIAQNLEIETGKTYLFQVRETKTSEKYGRQFAYTSLKELGAMEIVNAAQGLGKAEMVDVTAKVEDESSTKQFETTENEFADQGKK